MKKFIQKLYEKIWTIFAIRYWIQIHSENYNQSFDDWCRQSLDDGHYFTDISKYTAKFNGKTIWISNHPYGSFTLNEKDKPRVQPSRYTKHLMKKRFDDSWVLQYAKYEPAQIENDVVYVVIKDKGDSYVRTRCKHYRG